MFPLVYTLFVDVAVICSTCLVMLTYDNYCILFCSNLRILDMNGLFSMAICGRKCTFGIMCLTQRWQYIELVCFIFILQL